MSYHIEAYSEQPDPVTFVCEDPACGEKWSGDVETWACDIDGCDIACCPTCYVRCYFCSQLCCSAHRVKYNDDGNERWTCAPCKQVAEARDREDGPASQEGQLSTEPCCKRVFSGGCQDMRGHQCSRKAKVVRNGKSYCGIHDPEVAAERDRASRAKWLAESAARQKARDIENARKAICDAAIAYVEDCNLKFEEELSEAVAKLRSIEK